MGSNSLMHSFNRKVGIGSRLQDFVGEPNMIFRISSGVAGSNFSRDVRGGLFSHSSSESVKRSCISSIFSRKKFEKLFGWSSGGMLVGRDETLDLYRRSFIHLNKAFCEWSAFSILFCIWCLFLDLIVFVSLFWRSLYISLCTVRPVSLHFRSAFLTACLAVFTESSYHGASGLVFWIIYMVKWFHSMDRIAWQWKCEGKWN